jgi:hypothetical protein
LRVLATSRESLGVSGETVRRLDPLAPDDAQRLFLGRARERDPGFVPDADADAAIALLCERLDHLPLAIELAAARIGIMSPRSSRGWRRSAAARGWPRPATERCAPRSTGATRCWIPPSNGRSGTSRRASGSTCSRGWSTSRSPPSARRPTGARATRTVESHVRHVLAKAALTNRTELATWARDHVQ